MAVGFNLDTAKILDLPSFLAIYSPVKKSIE